MRVFLDFEASSLGEDSYPIEVGWIFEDGRSESHLIKPAEDWTDWDEEAQSIHGIVRETLLNDGEPHDRVAHRLIEALDGHQLFATAPSWDGKWLSVLLRSAGLPRHALRLRDSDEAHAEAVQEALGAGVSSEDVQELTERFLAEARRKRWDEPVEHRALKDAEQERRLWTEVRTLARAEAARRRASAVSSETG